MENEGFKKLFEKLEEEAGGKSDEASAAERLGRAVLGLLGPVEGVSEDELVDALIASFENRRAKPSAGAPAEEPEALPLEDELAEAPKAGFPFEKAERTPVPMRTAGAGSEPVDYSQMSPKQFSELKKLLKKATADGRRIRL